VERIDGRAGIAYDLDSVWADDVDRRFSQRLQLLESDLALAKTGLVKESVRAAHAALGEALYSRGEIADSFRQHLRTRDYVTIPEHILAMCLNVVQCALELRQYMHVGTYVQKAEAMKASAATENDRLTIVKLQCALGISQLATGKYKAAAVSLTSIPAAAELGNSFAVIATGGDIATYAVFCALATMDRADLASHVVDSGPFRELLSMAPPAVQAAVRHFHASRYGPALVALSTLLPTLAMDPFIADHAVSLYAAVRARAFALFSRPFSSLDLRRMALAFSMDVEELEGELATLIASKQITGRIDSHAKALFSRSVDPRKVTFKTSLLAGEQYLRDTKLFLLRSSMMRHDLVQKLPPGERPPERPEVPRHARNREGEGGGGGGTGRRVRGGGGGERDRGEDTRERFVGESVVSGSGSLESHDLPGPSAMLAD